MHKVELRVRVFRPSVLADSTEFSQTVMVAPIVSADAAAEAGGANVALVVDVSGSMAAENKLGNAQLAAHEVVNRLRPNDRLAIIAFDSDLRVIASFGSNAASIHSAIDKMTPGGGTEMAKGMGAAIDQLRSAPEGATRRVIVLTDGETSDDERCRQIADSAIGQGLAISTYGLGSEWNRELLSYIAERTKGHVGHIAGAPAVSAAIAGEFQDVQNTALIDAVLLIHPSDGISIRSVHRVIPDVVEYPVDGAAPHSIAFGDVSKDPETAPKFLIELVLPGRPVGQVRVARISLRYREPGDSSVRETDLVNAVVTYVTDHGVASMVDPEIRQLIEMRESARLVTKAEEAINKGDVVRATQLLSNAKAVTQHLGNAKVTQQLTEAIDELVRTGDLPEETRKTIQFGTKKTKDLGQPA